MNREDFIIRLKENAKIIDDYIPSYFDKYYKISEPMVYALFEGKRIRANLYFETLRMLGHDISDLDIDFAFAIELIHTYSLVHDDLPSMDDDDFRRGRESVHKKFGEDIGVLTGDGLLNEAGSLLFNIIKKNPSYLEQASYLMDQAGYKGMIEGQVLDLRASDYDLYYLLEVYNKKTAYLFMASIVSAGLLLGVSKEILDKLKDYAYNLGLSYQIQDDLLEEETENELNILNVTDRDSATKLLYDINDKARDSIADFNDNDFLLYLINFLSDRKK